MNGVDYQPQTASPNKKHAKAMAATVALQALGEVILKIATQAVVKFLIREGIRFFVLNCILSVWIFPMQSAP